MLRRTFITALLTTATLTGCGFQLRGPHPLPFSSIYLGMNPYAEFTAKLKRQIRVSGNTEVTEKAADAEVTLQVTQDDQEKVILSLSSTGTVREYELRRRFTFRVVDKSGHEVMPLKQIVVKRDISFSDSQVLAKEQEEALLYRDMNDDLVQQVMRRLAAAKM